MIYSNNFKYYIDLARIILLYIVAIVCIVLLCCMFFKHDTKPPVDERVNIDSIIKVNDSIKIQVESLDSIKNAKVIEVVTLDNDSSLKLFYKLVSQ